MSCSHGRDDEFQRPSICLDQRSTLCNQTVICLVLVAISDWCFKIRKREKGKVNSNFICRQKTLFVVRWEILCCAGIVVCLWKTSGSQRSRTSFQQLVDGPMVNCICLKSVYRGHRPRWKLHRGAPTKIASQATVRDPVSQYTNGRLKQILWTVT